jgi:hypothetical protein
MEGKNKHKYLEFIRCFQKRNQNLLMTWILFVEVIDFKREKEETFLI